MELSERKQQILKVVVEDYIHTAEPVGSKAIAAKMGVSSATVRNELADLVEMGYLEQPHTSAGRVPSPKGYRLYVGNGEDQSGSSDQTGGTGSGDLPGGAGRVLPGELPHLRNRRQPQERHCPAF